MPTRALEREAPAPRRGRSPEPGRLAEALRAVAAARDLPAVMAAVRHHARRIVSADGATFVLREGAMVHYADEDAISPLWKGRRFPARACISGVAMLRRESVVIEEIRDDPRVPQDAYRDTFVRSMAMVPIRREAPLGAIGAYWARRHRATPREVAALEALADAAASAVAGADLVARLERAVALRDELLALAAQELDTPLAAVRSRVDALERGVRGAAGPLDLAPVQAAVARLAETVSGLLEFSRASEQGIALAVAPVDLAEVARAAVADLRPRAEATGTELRLDAPAPVEGDWDRTQLVRAVGHLLETGAGFGRGRIVEVAVSESGEEGLVIVHRRGSAAPGAPRAPARFARAATPAHVAGLGLGLWMARLVAEAHGGTVTIEGAPRGEELLALRLPKRLPVD